MKLKQNTNVTFSEFAHEYITVDGHFLLGVTGLLHKHHIGPDMSGIPQGVLDRAAARGTAIHNLIEDYESGKSVVDTPELLAYKKLGLSVHCTEYLVSDNETVASFIDIVEDDCSLCDIKTWAKVDKDRMTYVTWQLSIYAYLFELQNPRKKVPGIYLLHVSGDTAKKIPLERISKEEVKALLSAEKRNEIYSPEVQARKSTDLALTSDETALLVSHLDNVARYKQLLAEAEKEAKSLMSKLQSYMEDNGCDELVCDSGVFRLKKGYERVTVDVDQLKSKYSSAFEACKKTSKVSASVMFTSKKQ